MLSRQQQLRLLEMTLNKVRLGCKNGHEIAIISSERGYPVKIKDITHPKLKNIKEGDVIGGCPDCGEPELIEIDEIRDPHQ